MSDTITPSEALEHPCRCGCGETFKAGRPHQKFVNLTHKNHYWQNLMYLASQMDQGKLEIPTQ